MPNPAKHFCKRKFRDQKYSEEQKDGSYTSPYAAGQTAAIATRHQLVKLALRCLRLIVTTIYYADLPREGSQQSVLVFSSM